MKNQWCDLGLEIDNGRSKLSTHVEGATCRTTYAHRRNAKHTDVDLFKAATNVELCFDDDECKTYMKEVQILSFLAIMHIKDNQRTLM